MRFILQSTINKNFTELMCQFYTQKRSISVSPVNIILRRSKNTELNRNNKLIQFVTVTLLAEY